MSFFRRRNYRQASANLTKAEIQKIAGRWKAVHDPVTPAESAVSTTTAESAVSTTMAETAKPTAGDNQLRAFIDTIDACQLKCPTCVRGVRVMQNSSAKMSLEKFCAVLDKAKSEGYRQIGLYSWTEPFLNRTLQDYVLEVKKRDLACLISTTLSLRRIDNLEATLLAKPDLINVSISGCDQATYQINHVDGKLSYVLANLERAVSIVRSRGLTTTFQLGFIKFDYNTSHEEPLRSHAAGLGINYEVIPGVCHPDTPDLPFHARSLTDDFIRKQMAAAPEASPESCGKICGCNLDRKSVV